MEQQLNYRKVKLLKLLEILQRETDQKNPLTTNQLCAKLADIGIPCDRRTLSQDVDVLNSVGYEIMAFMIGHEKAYYIEDRSFSIPELKILIDAVQAASFITEKKSEELIQKIAELGGTHQAEVLTRNLVCFNKRKHGNESIYYNISELEEAISSQHKVIFLYYDIGPDGEKQYRRDGHHYVVEPVQLVLNEDNYYLLSYSSRHRKTSVYRIDRMESVQIIEDKCTKKATSLRDKAENYTVQTFKMFGGPLVYATLEFNKDLIGPVYDKFGEDTVIKCTADDRYTARVHIQKSPTFWGWVFQFAGDMKILKPTALQEEYHEKVRSVLTKE